MGSGPVRFGPLRLWLGVGAFALAGASVPPSQAQPAPAAEDSRPAPPIASEAIPAAEPPADVPVIFQDQPAAPAAPTPAPPAPTAGAAPAIPPGAVPAPEPPPADLPVVIPGATPAPAPTPPPPAAPAPVAPVVVTPPSAASAPTAPPAPPQAAAPHAGHGAMSAGQAGEGGEGGEGGERGITFGASPDVAFAGQLMLVRGHLAIGMELARAGNWDDAVFHFLHPMEEIYDDLRPELRRRRAPGFAAALEVLSNRARAKRGGPGLEAAYRDALTRIDRALAAGVPARQRNAAPYVAEVAARTMRAAAAEYEAAIEDGRMANVVEYQDGRGFLIETEALMSRHAATLRAGPNGARDWAEAQAALVALRAAWPTPRPPATPAMSVTDLIEAVARFERAALRWR